MQSYIRNRRNRLLSLRGFSSGYRRREREHCHDGHMRPGRRLKDAGPVVKPNNNEDVSHTQQNIIILKWTIKCVKDAKNASYGFRADQNVIYREMPACPPAKRPIYVDSKQRNGRHISLNESHPLYWVITGAFKQSKNFFKATIACRDIGPKKTRKTIIIVRPSDYIGYQIMEGDTIYIICLVKFSIVRSFKKSLRKSEGCCNRRSGARCIDLEALENLADEEQQLYIDVRRERMKAVTICEN
ncbi:hypothetical protein BDB01DRAFT_832523 [Pilobolus umbonatus]|nr:hypothetical protein BDB01DRAFT_832523 [Pilobolus umbonatus]